MEVRPPVEVIGSPILEVAGDAARLSSWLGGTVPDGVVMVDGAPGVKMLKIPISSGEIVVH
jgi:hypothetical protein